MSIRLDVEVCKEQEKDDSIETNPVSKHQRIITVRVKEQLRCVDGHEQKLCLKQSQHRYYHHHNTHASLQSHTISSTYSYYVGLKIYTGETEQPMKK